MAKVVNPYNFVPLGAAPRRTAHDAYYAGKTLLTGRLDYTLTTATPLLIPDAAKMTEEMGHKRYPFFRLPDGTPAIPGSELRGAMRNVYEAVTHSCLSVLRDSTDFPFSQRLPSTNGFKERGLLGYDPAAKQWTLCPAVTVDYLKLTEDNYRDIMRGGVVYWNDAEYHNGQHTRLREGGAMGWLQFNQPVVPPKNGREIGAAYHVRLLAPRRDCPAVFTWADDTPYHDLCNTLGESAKNDSRSAAHGDLLAALKTARKQGGMVPVWYLLADDDGTTRCYLSGASIGRVMQNRSWAEVMGSHAPCQSLDALCPGCALFGTVKGAGTTGRVRFTDAVGAGVERLGFRTLPILSSPKPSAYEFYLGKPGERKAAFWNYDFYAVRDKDVAQPFRVYTPRPRGRKFYWHGQPKTIMRKSNQNATLEAVQGTFRGSVYFDRITREQLEELAFALTLGENTPDSTHLHKLGHGKPVGYGSAKIVLTGGELRTLTRQDGALHYQTQPVDLPALLAAHGRIDTGDESVRSLLRMADTTATSGKTVAYPTAANKKGDVKIFNWFVENRRRPDSMKTLPRPLDADITLNTPDAPPPRRYPYPPKRR